MTTRVKMLILGFVFFAGMMLGAICTLFVIGHEVNRMLETPQQLLFQQQDSQI